MAKDIYDVLYNSRPVRAERKRLTEYIPQHSVPPSVTVRTLVGSLLCMGADSPCAHCDVRCRYGREWLKMIEGGKVPQKYLRKGGQSMPTQEKKRYTPDEMADVLRSKATARGDDALRDAAEMLEDLSDRVERLRARVRFADERKAAADNAARRQLQKDLVLLSAYTGYQLVPNKHYHDVQKVYSEALGRPVMTHEMADVALHDEVKRALRLNLGYIIARAYGLEAATEGSNDHG